MTTIAVDRLTKRYGATAAVDDLSFAAPAGPVTGLLVLAPGLPELARWLPRQLGGAVAAGRLDGDPGAR